MITTGFLLGALTLGGFYLIYHKFPPWAKHFLISRPLFTDAVAAALTYILFQGTLIGLFAAAFCGILTSIMLAVRKNPLLMGHVKRVGSKYAQFLRWVENYGQERKELTEGAVTNVIPAI